MADVSGNATSLLQLLVTEINTGTNGSRALMSITTEYISPMIPRPAHYDEQVEALTAILGLIMLGLIAALAIRIYKSPSGSWLFRFVDGRERYLVPHGTISWASVLLLECMALEVYLCYHDTGASNISLTTAATSVSVAFAWTVPWLAIWSITVSHLLQRQTMSSAGGSPLTSARVINTFFPTTIFLVYGSTAAFTAVTCVIKQRLGPSIHSLSTQYKALAATWPPTMTVTMSDVAPLEGAMNQAISDGKSYHLYLKVLLGLYAGWFAMGALALNVIAIARLITLTKAAKVPSASSHPSGSAVGISEPYTSSTGAPAVPRNRELRNALWTLMALSAAMSLSTVAFCGTILQGLISGDVEQVSSRLILTLAYTTTAFGIPVDVILIGMSFWIVNASSPSSGSGRRGWKPGHGESVVTGGIHVTTVQHVDFDHVEVELNGMDWRHREGSDEKA